jgi:hypothetical protein
VPSLLSQIQAQTVHKLSNFTLGTDLAGFKASSMLLNHPTDGFQVRSILVARLTTQIVDLFIKGGRCKLNFFFHSNISLNSLFLYNTNLKASTTLLHLILELKIPRKCAREEY